MVNRPPARMLRSNARGATVVRLAIVMVLVGSLGLIPLLQGLHSQFASHEHRFCAEHQQIEEVPRDPQPGPSPSTSPDPAMSAFRDGATDPLASHHVACAVLNGASTREPLACAGASTAYGVVSDGSPVPPRRGADVLSLALLATAPKHSPPSPGC